MAARAQRHEEEDMAEDEDVIEQAAAQAAAAPPPPPLPPLAPAVMGPAAGPAAAVLGCPDLVKAIFQQLAGDLSGAGHGSRAGVCACAAVCRLWRAVADAGCFWRDVSFDCARRPGARDQLLAVLRRHHASVRQLRLSGAPCDDRASARALGLVFARLDALTELHLASASVPVAALRHLLAAPRLAALALDRVELAHEAGGANLAEAVFELEGLQSLSLTMCDAPRLALRCPSLTSLVLSGTTAAGLAPAPLPALQRLELAGCSGLTDAAVRALLAAAPSLATARFASCGAALTDETLRAAAALASLRDLSLDRCGAAVSLGGVPGFSALTRLEIARCDSVDARRLAAVVDGSPALLELRVEGGALLHTVALAPARLTSLALVGCRALRELLIEARALRELTIEPREPGLPAAPALRMLSVASGALARLELCALPALAIVRLDAPALRELRLDELDALDGGALVRAVCGSGGNGSGGSGSSSSGGGTPALESLQIGFCGALKELRLEHGALERLGIVRCSRLADLSVDARRLREFACDDDSAVERVALRCGPALARLSLGALGALAELRLEAPGLTALDLRGCGRLVRADLACPRLADLNAEFCGALDDAALARLVSGGSGGDEGGSGKGGSSSSTRPSPLPLERLSLSACPLVTGAGLAALPALRALRRLDASYLGVADAAPLLAAFPGLTSLALASCKQLDAASLLALVDAPEPGGAAAAAAAEAAAGQQSPHARPLLPHLRELDASYCRLPPPVVAALALRCARLTALRLAGVAGVDDGLWRAAAAAGAASGGGGGSALEALSLVKCPNLGSLCLGLVPGAPLAGGLPLSSPSPPPSPDAPEPLPAAASFRPAPCPFGRLRALRVSLSAVEVVALRLPSLEELDLSGCARLADLRLECARLTALLAPGCGRLPRARVEAALAGCPALRKLDLRHARWGGAAAAAGSGSSGGGMAADEPPPPLPAVADGGAAERGA